VGDLQQRGDNVVNDIQKARDVLAKWRERAKTPGPWRQVGEGDEYLTWGDITDTGEPGSRLVVAEHAGPDGALIVGTAGNPELLDAIDGLLAAAVLVGRWETEFLAHAKRLAAAIIAAEKRMSA
jgi:hypothetical protein